VLKVTKMSRQSRLSDAEVQRRLRDRAELGYGDEGARVPKIHAITYIESI